MIFYYYLHLEVWCLSYKCRQKDCANYKTMALNKLISSSQKVINTNGDWLRISDRANASSPPPRPGYWLFSWLVHDEAQTQLVRHYYLITRVDRCWKDSVMYRGDWNIYACNLIMVANYYKKYLFKPKRLELQNHIKAKTHLLYFCCEISVFVFFSYLETILNKTCSAIWACPVMCN